MPKPIEVFWSPTLFSSQESQWSLEYSGPERVLKNFGTKGSNPEIIKCPAVKDWARNLYSFSSPYGDLHKFGAGQLAAVESELDFNVPFLGDGGRLALYKRRPSGRSGYVNVTYNVAWLLHASESLVARFTAPYFPATTPTRNAYLASGEFDIGKWFRSYNLDYHLPLNAEEFRVEKKDPLTFVELMTTRPIRFRRFILTPELAQVAREMSATSDRYPKLSLLERYKMAHDTKIPKIVDKLVREAAVE